MTTTTMMAIEELIILVLMIMWVFAIFAERYYLHHAMKSKKINWLYAFGLKVHRQLHPPIH